MFETRSFTTAEYRVKSEGNRISGYAARTGILSHLIDGKFKERIQHRAFDGILATKPDVVMLVNHEVSSVLGRTTAGTLRLASDDSGLRFECDLPNTQLGRDTHELIKRGDFNNGCSFAFILGERDQTWAEEEDEVEDDLDLRARGGKRPTVIVRTITGFSKLHDVSVVTHPAYPKTSVDARFELVAAECRGFVEKLLGPKYASESRAFAGLPQSEIDDLVNNRDLTLYPLSDFERKQIEKRRKLLGLVLD